MRPGSTALRIVTLLIMIMSIGGVLVGSANAATVTGTQAVSVHPNSLPNYNCDGCYVDTGGSNLNVRSCPSTACSIVGVIGNGYVFHYPPGGDEDWVCQVGDGQRLLGNWGYTSVWDQVIGGSVGYVLDGYVYTGTNGVFHPC